MMKWLRQLARVTLAIFAVVVALMLALWVWVDDESAEPSTVSAGSTFRASPVDRQAKLDAIENARRQSDDVARNAAQDYRTLILEKKQGVPAFVSEVTGTYGKWLAVKQKLPFANGNEHEEFVSGLWAKHVLTQQELDDRRSRLLVKARRDLDGVQNRLTLAVRDERFVAPPPTAPSPGTSVDQASAVQGAASAARSDSARSVAGFTVTTLTGEVVTVVLTRVGVSAGLIAAGAANGWWTFGGSVVVGAGAAYAWNKWNPPGKQIESEVNRRLDELSESGSLAILNEVNDLAMHRLSHWNKMLETQP